MINFLKYIICFPVTLIVWIVLSVTLIIFIDMRNLIIISFTFLVLVHSQTQPLSQELLGDPQLSRIINNYFGCKNWQQGFCVQCSDTYYFNEKGICCEIPPNCRQFNKKIGKCQSCYLGFKLREQQCVSINLNEEQDIGCNKWEFSSQTNEYYCSSCSEHYYFNKQSQKCLQIDTFCSKFSKTQGKCLQCYDGYLLNAKNSCVLGDLKQIPDQGCKIWDHSNNKCQQCSFRWILKNQKCTPVNGLCKQWSNEGRCTSCYDGYSLQDQLCQRNWIGGINNLGCRTWDWKNLQCLQCSKKWIMREGSCVPLDDSCKSHNSEGGCSSCYKGYYLLDEKCLANKQFCKGIDGQGKCTSCFVNSVLYKNNCVRLSSLAELFLYFKQATEEEAEKLIEEGVVHVV